MPFRLEWEPQHPCVVLAGELDAEDEHGLRVLLAEVLSGGQGVVVDLSDATFCDSRIAFALVDANLAAAKAGLPGVVAVVPFTTEPWLRRLLLELVPVEEPLQAYPTRAAAERALERHPQSLEQAVASSLRSTLSVRATAWDRLARQRGLRDELALRRLDLAETVGTLRRGRQARTRADSD